MPPGGAPTPSLMYSKLAISACLRVSRDRRQISSALILARQGYAQHDPQKGFEERFHHGIIVATSFSAHRDFETML